ncbi:hypothetical protein SBOR_7727 [Sclerotinia borealis F-4128]|uniref:Phytase-like domain-containing protein n=1 Tax=Sclerotinia borealis (strain F-4128) TaxID=1432307 RepID=W9C573_SCLBF|nr:hypothetical protein SBOR_7727 [Sclerotinia borealis F-4128]
MSLGKFVTAVCFFGLTIAQNSSNINQTTCNGNTYTYQELGGYGLIPGDARDKFGDTIGGIGSVIAIDTATWTKLGNGSYKGVLWTLPDRGWNTQGTLNHQSQVHKFDLLFTPVLNATLANPSGKNLLFTYTDTVLFYGPDGTPTTGLDADGSGDGFGRNGTGGKRIPVDAEGLVLDGSGGFWMSDEYGPYIYHYNSTGVMVSAIRPPDAFIPMRNGSRSFSADSPYYYPDQGGGDNVSPADNPTSRDNNHGFEGLGISTDGKTLYTLLQAANNQKGGLKSQTERYARFLSYDISDPANPVYRSEYVVPLPFWTDPTANASKTPKVAAQSEIHALPNGQFLFWQGIPMREMGRVLGRFGVHNGGITDAGLLNEKWESMAVVPVDGIDGADGEWYIFSLSDNDFITQNGFLDAGKFAYSDASGYDLDNQALVFKVEISGLSAAGGYWVG